MSCLIVSGGECAAPTTSFLRSEVMTPTCDSWQVMRYQDPEKE